MDSETRRKVVVQRAGSEFGVFEAEEFDSLVKQGMFSPTDLCREEGEEGWVAFEAFVKRRKVRVYREPVVSKPEVEVQELPAPTRKVETSGWGIALVILFILATVVAVSWGVLQSMEVQEWKDRASALLAENEKLRAREAASFAENDLVPPGVIRGRVIFRNAQGRRVLIPGIRLRLFRRAELQEALTPALENLSQTIVPNPLSTLLRGLPTELEATVTDASGAFEFHKQEPGEYVVQTSVVDKRTGRLRAWFLTVDTRDELNTPIFITESNSVAFLDPLLIFNPAR